MPAQHVHSVSLPSGTLRLDVSRAEVPLDDLLTYAVRRNPRRGFLLVSRVLGKHIPVSPQLARQIWARLVGLLPTLHRPHFIGMAETATALGEGVARRWAAQHPEQMASYQHSTRYTVDAPLLLRFDEPHSHAPAHLLYDPSEAARSAQELVLIDDEISTGTTLRHLASAWLAQCPQVRRVILVSLTDWCSRREALQAALPVPVDFVSLLSGSLTFDPNPDWQPPPLPAVVGNGHDKTALLSRRSARLGHWLSADELMWPDLSGLTGRILVLGTGEYQYPAFALADALERRGLAVQWSATTRSPVLPGPSIAHTLSFADNVGDAVPNYLYNVDPAAYDHILVTYEGGCLPDAALLAQLGAHARAVRLS